MPHQHPVIASRKLIALRQAMGPVIGAALADPKVVEVMVNPDGRIWIDRIGEGRSSAGGRLSRDDAERVLRLLADHAGEVVTRERPRISATIPETGDRFQGAYMPIVSSPAFAIRKRPEVIFTLADYVRTGVMTVAAAEALRRAAAARNNLLIAGGTGSGKTTLANAILAEPVFKNDRIVLIEDTAELRCSAEDRVEMLTRSAEPQITMTDLVRDTLRLRPDRIIIGEVRDGSALDLLKAWNTGHPGGLATIHANSAADALTRLEDLIAEATERTPYRAIAQAINLVIYIERTPSGRTVKTIAEVMGREGDRYLLRDVSSDPGRAG